MSDTSTIIKALRILARDIQSDDGVANAAIAEAADRLQEQQKQIDELRKAVAKQNENISQTCGKALGYPWFKDDPKNFPGATEACGVCVGEHVAETIVEELAKEYAKAKERIEEQQTEIALLKEERENILHDASYPGGVIECAIKLEKAQECINQLNADKEFLRGEMETGFVILKEKEQRIKRLEEVAAKLANCARFLGTTHHDSMDVLRMKDEAMDELQNLEREKQ